MKWKGPVEGGITQSLINKFLVCPYQFYIYAGLGLKENKPDNDNLMWGDIFHKALELAIEHPSLIKDMTIDDLEEIGKKVKQHISDKWPKSPSTYFHTVMNMLKLYDDSYKLQMPGIVTELEFEEKYTTPKGLTCTLRGKRDGWHLPTKTLIEHKCKGRIDKESTTQEIPVDQQVCLYSMISGAENVIYDLILIPEAQYGFPQMRPGQTLKNYVDSWFSTHTGPPSSTLWPINKKKHYWFAQIPIPITQENIDNYRKFTLDPLIDRIYRWWDHVTQPGFDPDNPDYYNDVFYKTPIRQFNAHATAGYKGEYHDFLTGELALEDLIPVESFYAELTERT